MNSLVDVIHYLYDNLDLAFCVQDRVLHIVQFMFCGVHSGDHIHPGPTLVVSTAHKEECTLDHRTFEVIVQKW